MFENYSNYVIPALLIAYLGWRIWHFQKVRMKLPGMIKKGALIIDVRSHSEFVASSNPKSKNIPLASLSEKLGELKTDETVIVCCASGSRSAMAAKILKTNGFKDVVNAGSWKNTLLN